MALFGSLHFKHALISVVNINLSGLSDIRTFWKISNARSNLPLLLQLTINEVALYLSGFLLNNARFDSNFSFSIPKYRIDNK